MSDWIEHDGARPVFPKGCFTIWVRWQGEAELITPESIATINSNWPGFFWRWRRVKVGWFKSVLKRVCDNPAYAPITAYRFMDGGAEQAKSEAVELLHRIVADPPPMPEETDTPERVTG